MSHKRRGKPYRFEGEKIAFPLVEFLNGCPESDVHEIVRECLRLDEMTAPLDWSVFRPAQSQQWNDCHELAEKISQRMSKYLSTPFIVMNHLLLPEERIRKVDERGGRYLMGRLPPVIHPMTPTLVAMITEMERIRDLEEILKRDWIGRLKTCGVDDCRKWFFARKNNGRWCSPSCRQKSYDRSTERKEERKRNLALQKAGIVK